MLATRKQTTCSAGCLQVGEIGIAYQKECCLQSPGFLHPIIHLGFGIEFNQPAIIAEALAQASVHDDWITKYFLDVEKNAQPGNKTIPQLLEEIRVDKKLSTAAEWSDGNKIRDGILARAPDEMVKYASQWTVGKGELEAKTAQMMNSAVYFTAAAQRPPKQVSHTILRR